MCTISLNNMHFYAHHGCYETEQVVGTHFEVSLRFTYDGDAASESDDINQAVSYFDVYQVVKREVEIPSHLIENVALRIKKAVKEAFPAIETVTVSVSKLNPPLGGEIASVTVEI